MLKQSSYLLSFIQMFKSHYKFVIVGAGISGLRAAQILAENQQEFVVLQADDRIGGRICTLTIGQALAEDNIDCQFQWLNQNIKVLPVQCGATWLSQEQPVMRKIVKDFGLTMFSHYYEGSNIMALTPNQPSTYQHLSNLGQYYKLHFPKIQKLFKSLQELEDKFRLLNSNKKQGTLNEVQKKQLDLLYEKYDSMNAYEFILEEVQDTFLAKLLSNQVTTLSCAKPEDYSVLTLMAEDSFANIKYYLGAQACTIDGFRVKEGMSTIVNKIIAHIEQLTKRDKSQFVHLSSPVVEIRNGSYPVEVVTEKGTILTCEQVIVAVPIATMKKIKFGCISQGKKLILENQLMGTMARQAMIFKEPFWRKLNKSGYVSFSHEFPMNELVDLTPCDSQCGILGFVFTADGWVRWKAQIAKKFQEFNGSQLKKREYEMLQKQSFKILADLFLDGNVEHEYLKQMVTFTRSFSTKPYIVAAYQASPALGVLKQVNALGQDIQDARFSDEKNMIILGSDFSTEFRGFMEGAVRIAEQKIRRLLQCEEMRQSRL